jgi:hypothetical protein
MSAPLTMARFAADARRVVGNAGYVRADGLEALHDVFLAHPTGHERRRMSGTTLPVAKCNTNTGAPRCTAAAARPFRRLTEPRAASCAAGSRQRHLHRVPKRIKRIN